MNIIAFTQVARQIMNEYGLQIWTIQIDSAKRRNGQCNYAKRQLSFSKFFIAGNPESMILNTLLHEIAHALTPGERHSAKWAAKCAKIGYPNPTRCTASDMPKGKYQATCGKCGPIDAFRHRLTEHSQFQRHTACQSRVTWGEVS